MGLNVKEGVVAVEQELVKLELSAHKRFVDMKTDTLYEEGVVYKFAKDKALDMLGLMDGISGIPIFKRHKPKADVEVLIQKPAEVDMTQTKPVDSSTSVSHTDKRIDIGDESEIAEHLAADKGEGVQV